MIEYQSLFCDEFLEFQPHLPDLKTLIDQGWRILSIFPFPDPPLGNYPLLMVLERQEETC